MESQTPVNITGVFMSASRVAGRVSVVKNKTGGLHAHQVHSTMTDLQTPVYNSAPMGTRTAVFQNINQPYRTRNYLFSPENDPLA